MNPAELQKACEILVRVLLLLLTPSMPQSVNRMPRQLSQLLILVANSEHHKVAACFGCLPRPCRHGTMCVVSLVCYSEHCLVLPRPRCDGGQSSDHRAFTIVTAGSAHA